MDNYRIWSSVEDIPKDFREAVIWRLGCWGSVDPDDKTRLVELCGAGTQAVIAIFEAERIRWAVKHLLQQFPGAITTQASIKAVALISGKSFDRVDQIYRRKIVKQQAPREHLLESVG